MLEATLGAVPVVGDVFHVFWKANRRNYKLLIREKAQRGCGDRPRLDVSRVHTPGRDRCGGDPNRDRGLGISGAHGLRSQPNCPMELQRRYPRGGEKSVKLRNVESIFSTSLPLASDFSFTLFHSGSSWKVFQFAVAASRLGCSRM